MIIIEYEDDCMIAQTIQSRPQQVDLQHYFSYQSVPFDAGKKLLYSVLTKL